jgi:hypothetical protein
MFKMNQYHTFSAFLDAISVFHQNILDELPEQFHLWLPFSSKMENIVLNMLWKVFYIFSHMS